MFDRFKFFSKFSVSSCVYWIMRTIERIKAGHGSQRFVSIGCNIEVSVSHRGTVQLHLSSLNLKNWRWILQDRIPHVLPDVVYCALDRQRSRLKVHPSQRVIAPTFHGFIVELPKTLGFCMGEVPLLLLALNLVVKLQVCVDVSLQQE